MTVLKKEDNIFVRIVKEPLNYMNDMVTIVKGLADKKQEKIEREKLLDLLKRDYDRIVCDFPDMKKSIDEILKNGINMLCSPIEKKYSEYGVSISFDRQRNKFYVNQDGKRLYYCTKYRRKRAVFENYLSMIVEQDEDSPHRYLDPDDDLDAYVMIDCGSAEASLPLKYIDKLKRLYLFEADTKWCEALADTFEPWRDKVKIINGFVGNNNANGYIDLSDFIERQIEYGIISEDDPIYIKMDIEGMEELVTPTLYSLICSRKNIHLSVCVYHSQDAYTNIINSLPKNVNVKLRSGYMLFYCDNLVFPYLRHGVVKIDKD